MKIQYKLNSENYANVQLKDSPFKSQMDTTVNTYLNIPNDSMLYPFRVRAGKEAPGRPLNGWYGRHAMNFGQFCGALAKMYKQSGNPLLKAKLHYLLEEWADCIEADGYSFSPEKKRYQEYIIAYEYEKLIGGLVDAYKYADYKDAFVHLRKITLWFKDHSPLEDRDKLYMVEWYTLPENLYRAYEASGDRLYKELGDYYEYPQFWERFLDDKFAVDKTKHAYSHVNSLSSAAMAYVVSGDEKFLNIIKSAYDEITQKHIYATGGYGPQEDMFGKDGYMGDSLKSAWDSSMTEALIRVRHDAQGNCEVSCCTWAVFKLCRYLLALTGEAKYGAWAEKMLYNGVLSLPPVTQEGKVMYYANYFVDGGIKSTLDRRYHGAPEVYDDLEVTYHYNWQCCTGTYPQAAAEYVNMLYFTGEDTVYVSQYIPSVYSFEMNGKAVELECITDYPKNENITYEISCREPAAFTLNFRIPAWVKEEVVIHVNGAKVPVSAGANQWCTVDRVWQDGDVITIRIPMCLYFEPIDEQNKGIAALCYGPMVLVTDDLAAFTADPEHPESWIRKISDEEPIFRTDEGCMEGIYDFETRTFAPYYSYPELKWYFMYVWLK